MYQDTATVPIRRNLPQIAAGKAFEWVKNWLHTGKPCKAARKVGSDMCARCPGGAYGLSKARAEAIKSFVAKCGVDVDRVYAVGFAGTRRLSDDITEEKGAVNRRVEVHMMPYAPPGRL